MEFTMNADADGAGALRLMEWFDLYINKRHINDDIEAVQALINTARVEAGSQYAALESAVNYTVD